MSMFNDPAARAETVKALRDFADLVEADPTIPTPNSLHLWSFLTRERGTEAERFAAVYDFAEAHRGTVRVQNDNDRQTAAHFGPIELTVHAFADGRRSSTYPIVTRADDPALAPAGTSA